jgi:hypothetical protein
MRFHMVCFLPIGDAQGRSFKSTLRIMALIQASLLSRITCFKFTGRMGPSMEYSNAIPRMADSSFGCNQWLISIPLTISQSLSRSAYRSHHFPICRPSDRQTGSFVEPGRNVRIGDNPLIAEVCSNCSLIVPFTSTGKLIRSTLSIRFRMSWLSSEGLLSLPRALLLLPHASRKTFGRESSSDGVPVIEPCAALMHGRTVARSGA